MAPPKGVKGQNVSFFFQNFKMLFLLQITWYSHVTYAYSSLDILYKSYGSRNSLKVIWGHRGQKIIFTKNATSPTDYMVGYVTYAYWLPRYPLQKLWV